MRSTSWKTQMVKENPAYNKEIYYQLKIYRMTAETQ